MIAWYALIPYSVAFAASAIPAPTYAPEAGGKCLVGVYYFAGWWRDTPNKYQVGGDDWRHRFPERRALLGEFNEQATMDREIAVAARFGVDFFQILWYPKVDGPQGEDAARIDRAVEQFMVSPNARRLHFTLEYVNHAPFDLPTDSAWREACRTWVAAMRHRSYLRVNGRPVFKVHHLSSFVRQSGSVQEAADRLAILRTMAKAAGAGDPLIGGGVVDREVPDPETARLVDYFATYMGMDERRPQRSSPYPYSELLAWAEDSWALQAAREPLPYVPYVPSGWDPRPWHDPRPSYTAPTREEWRTALQRVKDALDRSPRCGLPAGDGRVQKALLIYAWNEFGEGGILAPTELERSMKLEVIRDLFER